MADQTDKEYEDFLRSIGATRQPAPTATSATVPSSDAPGQPTKYDTDLAAIGAVRTGQQPPQIDPVTGLPYQFASTAGSSPVAQATGKPISENQLPGFGTQVKTALATDQEQRRRIAAQSLFPNLSPNEAQSRVFYGDNGRLAAVDQSGNPFYVDPARVFSGDGMFNVDPYSSRSLVQPASSASFTPRNLLAAGEQQIPGAAKAAPIIAGQAVAGPAGAGGASFAADMAQQALANYFDPKPGGEYLDWRTAGTNAAANALLAGAGNEFVNFGRFAVPRGVGEVPPFVPPPTPVQTAAEAKAVAGKYYDIANDQGGILTPQFTNKFLDDIASTGARTPEGQAAAGGTSEVNNFVQRMQALKDQPMTLQGVQEVDKQLGNLIDQDYRANKGLSEDGRNFLAIQRGLRDSVTNAAPGDITGGTAGFDALGPARKAWSQAMKMDDLERMQYRASLTDNPVTSLKNQIRTTLTGAKSRGYSDDEVAAMEDAASRGAIGGALHVFGNRLVPWAAGIAAGSVAAGQTSPWVAAAIGPAIAGATHVAGVGARDLATYIATRRAGNAMRTFAGSVPPAPLSAGVPYNPLAAGPGSTPAIFGRNAPMPFTVPAPAP